MIIYYYNCINNYINLSLNNNIKKKTNNPKTPIDCSTSRILWGYACFGILWEVRKERNARTFCGRTMIIDLLGIECLSLLLFGSCKGGFGGISLLDLHRDWWVGVPSMFRVSPLIFFDF